MAADQVVVKLQYSHKLGDVGEPNLQKLLDNLSKYRKKALQWTLSAPIQQASDSCETDGSTADPGATLNTTATSTNQFCMTNPPAPWTSASWPTSVTKPTDTVLIDYWFSVVEIPLTDIDTFVKTTVSTWVKEELKYSGQVWIVSRFTEYLSVPKNPHSKNTEKTIEKVIGQGFEDTCT